MVSLAAVVDGSVLGGTESGRVVGGEVVGGSLTEGDENFHGFLYRNNRLYDLNELLAPDAGLEILREAGLSSLTGGMGATP